MTSEPFPSEIVASPTGAKLHVHYRAPDADERGVVHINHGLAEHAARYAPFAAFLAERGFHVYAHDHRGHGHTTAPDAPARQFGHKNGGAKVLADVAAIHELIGEQHSGLPLILFGHSMGGLIALNYVMLHPRSVAGAAVWNANFTAGAAGRAARALLRGERMFLGSDVPSRMMPRLTFQSWAAQVADARTPFDWLSRDEAAVDAYITDPNCGWDASVGMWRDVLDFVFRGAEDRNLKNVPKNLPFHLVGGDADPSTDMGRATKALAGRLADQGFSDVECHVYPGMRHESLNETGREAVMEDFARWAERIALTAS
jgi:alpha-beta hydrolase superfamily lysophospholipase